MAPAAKANYKSYEAQARMVRAIVAAHPDVKWNYKDIAKYFGESTADGIQFQFRTIKKDATAMKSAVDAGKNPTSVLSLGHGSGGGAAAPYTPVKRSRNKKVPESAPSKLSLAAKDSGSSDAEDDGDGDDELVDYDKLDTPTKPRSKTLGGRVTKNQNPSSSANSNKNGARSSSRATSATAAQLIAENAALEQTASESELDTPTNPEPAIPAAYSLFGGGETEVDIKPQILQSTQAAVAPAPARQIHAPAPQAPANPFGGSSTVAASQWLNPGPMLAQPTGLPSYSSSSLLGLFDNPFDNYLENGHEGEI